MSILAVILDIDGLMLDTEPLYKITWQRAGRPPTRVLRV
jgi:beta-phosphoglucomutase-like phosphatase (HAD superfamily)